MNPIFKHGPSPQHRLVLVLFCSVLLIFFDYKMARAMIKNGNTNNITVNLDNLVIKNRNFNFNKEKILSSDFSDLQEDIDFLKNVAKISTKQTENRIRTLFLSY
mgnify:CR=1 FL=1